MKNKTILCLSLGVVLALSAAVSVKAQGRFTGDFLFGFRLVDTSGPGADYKYREDINLRRGARLSNFNLSYQPDNGLKGVFDRLDIRVLNLGGDPYETISVGLQKHGRYQLQYDRRKSAYFYQDLTRMESGGFYDLHIFDFDRIQDSGTAKVRLSKAVELYFDFNRYTKKGASTTTLDINRVEFEFDKPVQEDSREVAFGLDARFSWVSLVLEEKFLDYKNEGSYFLPGFTDGGPDADYPSSLNYFFMNQPYDLSGNRHSLRFSARPVDRLLLSGSGQIFNLDQDLSYSESASGLDYLNRKFAYDYSGQGRFDRDILLAGFDVHYLLLTKFSLIGAVRFHNFDQTGTFTIDGEAESQDIGYETWGVDIGGQYAFSSALILTLGYRFEDRSLDNLETVDYGLDTTRNGFFGNVRWDPLRKLKLTFDYEHTGYQNPYALISPTSSDRLRMTAKYQVREFSFSASYLWNGTKSDLGYDDITPFKTNRNRFSLRAGYHRDRLKAFAGYSYLQSKREGDRTVEFPPSFAGPGGTFLWDILYEGKGSIFDANLSYDLTPSITLGGHALLYSNSGSYEVGRTTLKLYLEYNFAAGYVAQAGYRRVNFKEDLGGDNNYKANILELSFGYRWK
ncbi:MAG: hypothetical protein WBC70_07805 [Candidatus Aminicenantales bacterium]